MPGKRQGASIAEEEDGKGLDDDEDGDEDHDDDGAANMAAPRRTKPCRARLRSRGCAAAPTPRTPSSTATA